MSTADILAVAGVVSVTAAFLVARRSIKLFAGLGVSILALFAFVVYRTQTGSFAESLLLEIGLALYWIGLLGVQAMLQRSVSLQLLSRLPLSGSENFGDSDIAARLEDGEACGLFERRGKEYRLTGLGRIAARVVRSLYLMTRAERWRN